MVPAQRQVDADICVETQADTVELTLAGFQPHIHGHTVLMGLVEARLDAHQGKISRFDKRVLNLKKIVLGIHITGLYIHQVTAHEILIQHILVQADAVDIIFLSRIEMQHHPGGVVTRIHHHLRLDRLRIWITGLLGQGNQG